MNGIKTYNKWEGKYKFEKGDICILTYTQIIRIHKNTLNAFWYI